MSNNIFQEGHPRRLIPDLCKQFYDQGWFSGTGGGISIKQGSMIYVAPSGVQKERLDASDLFVLKNDGSVSQYPPQERKLTLSQCTPLFMNAFKDRNALAVLHSHSKHVVLASLLYKGSEFKIKNLEMLKGIYHPQEHRMYRYDEELVIPIIENTCFEADLKDTMLAAMRKYPSSNAVIVRRHGIYVWGDSWQQCKTMAECYHYLCEMAVDMERLGINEYTKTPMGAPIVAIKNATAGGNKPSAAAVAKATPTMAKSHPAVAKANSPVKTPNKNQNAQNKTPVQNKTPNSNQKTNNKNQNSAGKKTGGPIKNGRVQKKTPQNNRTPQQNNRKNQNQNNGQAGPPPPGWNNGSPMMGPGGPGGPMMGPGGPGGPGGPMMGPGGPMMGPGGPMMGPGGPMMGPGGPMMMGPGGPMGPMGPGGPMMMGPGGPMGPGGRGGRRSSRGGKQQGTPGNAGSAKKNAQATRGKGRGRGGKRGAART